jgi:indole-3-glycerol phosphate synthase
MSSDLLAAVVAAARRSAEARGRAARSAGAERAAASYQARGAAFRAGLRAPGVRIIAECKRRSPSRGVLRRDYDPVAIARGYAAAGAAAISVLTEPTFFDGALDHLRAARDAVSVPLLRKDFIVTEAQVVESRAVGADAILLIVAALDDAQLARLLAVARDLELEALVEVHSREELRRAKGAGASIVGVNSRNLRTLQMAPQVFVDLAPDLPGDAVTVAESGLGSGADLARLQAIGYRAFLIGERFVTEADPGSALAGLMRDAEGGP